MSIFNPKPALRLEVISFTARCMNLYIRFLNVAAAIGPEMRPSISEVFDISRVFLEELRRKKGKFPDEIIWIKT